VRGPRGRGGAGRHLPYRRLFEFLCTSRIPNAAGPRSEQPFR